MSEVKFIIPQKELFRITGQLTRHLNHNYLKEMGEDVMSTITRLAQPYRGVSSPSIADETAIKVQNDKQNSLKIMPSLVTEHVFEVNKYGYPFEQHVYVNDNDDLFSWVLYKYSGKNRDAILQGNDQLRIRPSSEVTGDPLGSKNRDFFGRAFKELIKNKAKYNLVD